MGIMDRWNQYRELKRRQGEKEAAAAEWIERMVQETDPSIRKVEGYRKQLRTPVENALRHVDGVISAIPGPFRLTADRWDTDPLMHALFVNPGDIQSLLQSCADLKSFFQKSGVKTAVALLTATKVERTVFGTALEGEILRRDVAQTVVEFYDHRVIAPGATEEESRRELIPRGLYLLATYALEEVMQVQALREELTAQRNSAVFKIKIQQTRDRGVGYLLAGSSRSGTEVEKWEQFLAEIDQQLTALGPGSGTPRDYLRKLDNVLSGADTVLTEKTQEMRLNWMGVKQGGDATGNGQAITMTELEIPNRVKRVAVLATVSAGECLGS
ncbi:hypothetical protein [Desulfococcus sp.]|uniref:hypothetical protein n=1 Tax=Desulfococcus sp. TaxID=2025834 RepID=UPI003594580E